MKKRILSCIYKTFDAWTGTEAWACAKGCATCCSQNVTITALEGEEILDHIVEQNRAQWLAEKLGKHQNPHRPQQTMNDFARSCLAGEDPPEASVPEPAQACPFLDKGSCTIYEVRPFNCRCFLSKERCSPHKPALVDNKHLAAATALSQLIEHLGQFGYWGNMLDVLPAMLNRPKYDVIRHLLADQDLPDTSRRHILKAKPLPGFLLEPEDYQEVEPLLNAIFREKIENKTIEAILNGAN